MAKGKERKLNPKQRNGQVLGNMKNRTKVKTKNLKTVESDISVMANNKKQLVDFMKKQLKKGQSYKTVLSLKRVDCGCVHEYKTFEDIPETDVVCEHGNRIIIYSDNHE